MPSMSLHARQEYLQKVKKRYLKASAEEKGAMLDEYCANTKLNRKYVIRCLSPRVSLVSKMAKPRKRRSCAYTNRETYYLKKIWDIMDYPCGARLAPMLGEMMSVLGRCHELTVPDDVKKKLLRIAPSTIDEKMKTYKADIRRRFNGTTKPGSLLKNQIPIRTSSWEETRAGFCELDTVAHCGDSAEGEFVNSLDITDMLTGWTEGAAFIGKAEKRVKDGLDEAKNRLPFTLRGIDPDNGSEFINWQLFHYCEKESIQFTRGRPYHKNDNAHIEQKNWTRVRKVFGYERRETEAELAIMNDLYRNELRLYKNFFQPTMKLVEKKRAGEHQEKIKRIYDTPKTPYQRVLNCPDIPEEKKEELKKIYATLNPAALRRSIIAKLKQLQQVARQRKQSKKTITTEKTTAYNARTREFEGGDSISYSQKTKKEKPFVVSVPREHG